MTTRRLPNFHRTPACLVAGCLAMITASAACAGVVTVTGGGATQDFSDMAGAMAWISDPSRSGTQFDVQVSGGKNTFAGCDLAANATLHWGNSPGVLELLGTRQVPYHFSGTMTFDIGGTDNSAAFEGGSNVDYDTVLVMGGPGVIFDGVLQVNLYNGFVPSLGQKFELIAATGMINWYGTVQGPTLPNGMNWSVSILPSTLDGGQSVFVMTVVPAPGAIALLGCCGVLGSRRRRA